MCLDFGESVFTARKYVHCLDTISTVSSVSDRSSIQVCTIASASSVATDTVDPASGLALTGPTVNFVSYAVPSFSM